MENCARSEVLMGGVFGNDTEVEREGTQEEGACGVASQEGQLVGSRTEPSRARIRESYENWDPSILRVSSLD